MDKVSIQLSKDELLTLLRIVGITTMNGFPPDPWEGLSDLQIAERLNMGEQSLLNRELIAYPQPDSMLFDDVMIALVGASTVPEASYLLGRGNRLVRPSPHYFASTPQIMVEHYSPRAGMIDFEYVASAKDLRYRVEAFLAEVHLIDGPASSEPMALSRAPFQEFLDGSRTDQWGQAEAALAESGLPDAVQLGLLKDLEDGEVWWGAVWWNLGVEGEIEGDAVLAITGDSRCWLVESTDEDPPGATIRKVNGLACEDAFVRLLQPLIDVNSRDA